MNIYTWCSIPSTMVFDAIPKFKLYGLILDLEHGLFNWETIANMAYHNQNTFVRVNFPIDEREINYAMELSLNGIFVPHTECSATVCRIKDIIKNKGISPYTKVMDYGWNLSPNFIKDHLKAAQSQLSVIYMIEGDGINNFQNILETLHQKPNINDSIYIGIYDLSNFLGVAGDITHKVVIKEMKNLIRLAKQYEIDVGTYARDAKDAQLWKKMGIDFVAIGSDIGYMVAKYKEELNKI